MVARTDVGIHAEARLDDLVTGGRELTASRPLAPLPLEHSFLAMMTLSPVARVVNASRNVAITSAMR